MNWYTSDLHFGHRFVSGLRGFGTDQGGVSDHDASIINAWCNVVKKDDIIYVLGDIAVSGPRYALDLMVQLPGRKILISGNHDGCHPMHRDAGKRTRTYVDVFEWVTPFARRRINGTNVLMSHFPYTADHTEEARYEQYRLPDHGEWLLHGHTHGTERVHGHEIHVGWDAWGRLVAEDEIASLLPDG